MGDLGAQRVSGVSARSLPVWRAAYSDRTAAVMARLCELAYLSAGLPTRTKPGLLAPALPVEQTRSALQSALDTVGLRLVAVFSHASTQAFLAICPEFAVLAFRGTATLADWGVDVDAVMAELALPNGRGSVWVHEGFLRAFKGCEGAIRAALEAHVPADLGLYITGHSLGGALAQIASAALERDTLAACYTFGSPRVGALAFDTVVKCPHYRVVDHWDMVPTVPPPFVRGYLHSGDPRLIARGAQAALRRDRSLVMAVAVNLLGLAGLIATRRALIVDDHMIARYRSILETIARDRQTSTSGAVKQAPRGLSAALAAAGAGLALGLWMRRRRR